MKFLSRSPQKGDLNDQIMLFFSALYGLFLSLILCKIYMTPESDVLKSYTIKHKNKAWYFFSIQAFRAITLLHYQIYDL